MNNIGVDYIDQGIRFKFLNGSILLPYKYGGYVIAPGCGAGKTTAIKDLIRQKYSKGILYTASTIDECNLMYEYCKELVSEVNDPKKLTLDDIVVVHSGGGEGVDNSKWRSNPNLLADKKILICTHHKLMNEYLPYLTRTTFNKVIVDNRNISVFRRAFDEFEDTPTVRSRPREYILIDEVPTNSSIEYEVNKDMIDLLAHREVTYGRVTDELTGELVLRTKEINFLKPLDYSEMSMMFDRMKSIVPVRTNGSKKSAEEISDVVASSIYENFNELARIEKGDKKVLSYSISDFITEHLKSYVYVFDGTGDITFGKTSEEIAEEAVMGVHKFTAFTTGSKKYNSPITIGTIDFDITRSLDTTDEKKISEIVDKVQEVILKNKKTLVITWKNFRKGKSSESSDLKVITDEINENCRLTSMYESALYSRGLTPDQFSIIHYQSGKDKATNDYMDYDSILFLGEFHVPNYVVSKFNDTFRCKCTPFRYQLYQVIQAICRTRIRKHKGLPINVYFSSDWNTQLMNAVKLYLDAGADPITIGGVTKGVKTLISSGVDGSILSLVTEKWRSDISALMTACPALKVHLEQVLTGKILDPIALTFKLSEIKDICPRKKVEINSYRKLIEYLRSKSVVLEISSRKS